MGKLWNCEIVGIPITIGRELQNLGRDKRDPPIPAQLLRETRISGGTGFVPSTFAKVLQLSLVTNGFAHAYGVREK